MSRYVEQPAGVGFSTGREPQNEKEVGWDFYHFLVNFYKVFEDLQPHRLTIFGESYAGMFVPAIAHRIFKENQNSPELHINLDGIALGNGWMNGRVQGPMAIDYAWYHGMIDAYTRDAFHAQWEHCTTSDGVNMTGEIQSAPFHPFTTPDECGVMDAVLQAAGAGNLPHGLSPNKYDVTTFDPLNIVSSHDSTVAQFMNNPDVKKALNAPEGITWSGCMPDAGRRRRLAAMLNDDKPVSVVPYVAELLDNSDVRVLVYNGDLDMACNAQGSETLLNDMKWSGHEAWKVAGRGIWILQQDETIAGYVKSFSNLMFLVVKNSGHLVPYNQPAQGLELVERFLEKRPFIDIPLPSFVISIPTAPPGEEHDEDDDFDFDLNSNSDQFNAYNKASSFTTSKWVIQQLIFAVVCFLAGAILSRSWRTRTGYESVS